MSTAGYLQDAKNQQKRLAEIITSKGITATATEKYKDLIDKVAQIENLKGEERTLENFTNVLSEPKSVVQLEYPEPKNLFSLANRAWANFGASPNTTVRNINKDNFYFQVSSNNYVNNSKTGYEIVNGNTIKITGVHHAYGLGVPFHLIAGQQYTISCIRDNEKSRIRVSYYDVNGNYLSEFIDLPGSFTVPENAYWTMILFIAYNPVGASSGELTFSNIQLELGTTATPYEPYPAPKTLNAKLGSKNLIPYPYAETTKTINGITFTDNGDGTITTNGTATADAIYSPYTVANYFELNTGETYTASDLNLATDGNLNKHYIQFKYVDGDINIAYLTGVANTYTFTAKYEKIRFNIVIKAGQTVENLVFKPQLELGSTATAYTPYIPDLTSVSISRCGKNLIPYPYVETTKTQNGITFTDNGDGSITINGTADKDAYFRLCIADFGDKFINAITTDSATNGIYTVSKRLYYNHINKTTSINILSGATVDETIYPQLELGTTATSYEPYQGQTYTPTASGEVTGITNLYPTTTLLTDNAGVVFEQVTGETYKEILPSTDKNGITKVYQPSVDSTIDSNIKPENIKKGITILGVTGTYEPTA